MGLNKRRVLNEVENQMISNNQLYIDCYDRLKLVALSLFEWEGLDDVAGYGASRFLEKTLFEEGRACFVKDNQIGYQVLRANPNDKQNNYELPTSIMAWSINYHKSYPLDECVYIMNNDLVRPTAETTRIFANYLYEIQSVINTNVNAQKTPILITGTESQKLTLKNLYMQYDGNTPVIFGDSNTNLKESLSVLKTDAPYIADKLYKHKHEMINEFLTYLGINNANTDKKERMIVDEVNSNNELINYYLNCFLKTRQLACDKINKMYGLNIKIKVNSMAVKDLARKLGYEENEINIGVGENE